MKKPIIISIGVLAVLVALGWIFLSQNGNAQRGREGYGYGMGPGHMMRYDRYGQQQYCPYCGNYVGPYGGRGYGMGPGMMHHGWGVMGPETSYQKREKPLRKKEAKELLEKYADSLFYPDLKLGKITEEDKYFEGEILTRNDVLIDKIIVNKDTGWMHSAMRGPEMMGYGRRGGYHGMGPGMMGPGYRRYGSPYRDQQEPLKKEDARNMVENYLTSTRNPNLKVGKIEEKDTTFEAEILTKNNDLVDKIMINKFTGWMQSVY